MKLSEIDFTRPTDPEEVARVLRDDEKLSRLFDHEDVGPTDAAEVERLSKLAN